MFTVNRCSLIRCFHFDTFHYYLPASRIYTKCGVSIFYTGSVDYNNDANAYDLDAIKLMCQQPLASGCDEEFAIMTFYCVGTLSINMPRPCQHHSKKQWNCMGGCVRSLTLPNWSALCMPIPLAYNYSCTCNQCYNTGMSSQWTCVTVYLTWHLYGVGLQEFLCG